MTDEEIGQLKRQLAISECRMAYLTHWLRATDSCYHSEGLDYTPMGWNITLSEMLRKLEQPGWACKHVDRCFGAETEPGSAD